MTRLHDAAVAITHTIPPHAEPGADLTVAVSVSCPLGCDLHGQRVLLSTGEGDEVDSELVAGEDSVASTEPFNLHVPENVGEHVWQITFPRHEHEGSVHLETTCLVPVVVGQHKTSMAVWGVPTPVVAGSVFRVRVGVQCAGLCRLTGQFVEVRNEAGTQLGAARLGDAPLDSTPGLYWAEVELPAPTTTGVSQLVAAFAPQGSGAAHEPSRAGFSFRTDPAPEHTLAVKVVARDTRLPVDDVEVHCGLYAACTDAQGVVAIRVPTGTYTITTRKDGFRSRPETVDVQRDQTILVEAASVPTKAEREADVAKMMGYGDYPWG